MTRQRIDATVELLLHYFDDLGRVEAEGVAQSIANIWDPPTISAPTAHQGDCEVNINSIADGRMIRVIKAIRQVAPTSLKDAKFLCDTVLGGCSANVLRGVSEDYARYAKDMLVAAGATVTILSPDSAAVHLGEE